MPPLRQAIRYIVERRPAAFFHGIRRRLPAWLFRYADGFVFALDLPRSVAADQRSDRRDDAVFAEATPGQILTIAATAGLTASEVQRRYQQGDRCYATLLENKPVHIVWIHEGNCFVRGLGLELALHPNQCYVYGVFTSPEARGRGLYRSSHSRLLRLLERAGVSRIIEVVDKGTPGPLKILPEVGFQLQWRVHHVTFCGLRMTTFVHAEKQRTIRRFRWGTPRRGLLDLKSWPSAEERRRLHFRDAKAVFPGCLLRNGLDELAVKSGARPKMVGD